jgi:NADH-quinone oxidoreductase subunit M
MGPVKNEEYLHLPQATWYETTGILLLLIPIVSIGVSPFWLSEMITKSIQPFIQGVL